MFDEQTNPSAPSASPANAPSPANNATPPAADDIHTMPMEYYLGADTVAATNAGKPIQTGKVTGAQMKAGSAVVSKKKWINYALIGGLVVVVGISAFLLVKSYEKPAPPQTAPAPIVTAAPETAPLVEPTLAPEVKPEPPTTPASTSLGGPDKVEPKKFSLEVLSQFSLSSMLGADADNDGLTDAEETLFGTDAAMVDSDGDVYKDAEEVANLYSPVDAGSIRLWDKQDILAYYTNPKYGYKLLYPTAWLIQPLNSDDPNDLMITSNQNEFLDVLVFDKKPAQSLKNWYGEMVPTVSAADMKEYQTLKKLNALESPDGFTVYIEGPAKDKIYAINYNIGLKDQASFPTVFLLAVQSFELVAAAPAP